MKKKRGKRDNLMGNRERERGHWVEGGQCGQYVYLPRTRFQGPYCRVCYEKKPGPNVSYITELLCFLSSELLKGVL